MISFLRAVTHPPLALVCALLGATLVLVVALLPTRPVLSYPMVLLGIWLCFAALIRYAALIAERASLPESRAWIPLRFSGPIGRFRLRPRGDGRRVEVRAGSQVVAEVIADDGGDQLVFDPTALADSELEAFGTALGQAIEMAAAADEDRPAERHVAGPSSWRRA